MPHWVSVILSGSAGVPRLLYAATRPNLGPSKNFGDAHVCSTSSLTDEFSESLSKTTATCVTPSPVHDQHAHSLWSSSKSLLQKLDIHPLSQHILQ